MRSRPCGRADRQVSKRSWTATGNVSSRSGSGRHLRTGPTRSCSTSWTPLRGQRDAVHSRLFWYTDLDRAVAAAESSRRPILSLRLLGRLDEELSCANSRFFRTVLYPDPEINQLLSERFVLHWESVRPVPRVTIDLGNGNVLQQTIAGDSAHYVLTPEGEVVDAIPGAHGPQTFPRPAPRHRAAGPSLPLSSGASLPDASSPLEGAAAPGAFLGPATGGGGDPGKPDGPAGPRSLRRAGAAGCLHRDLRDEVGPRSVPVQVRR